MNFEALEKYLQENGGNGLPPSISGKNRCRGTGGRRVVAAARVFAKASFAKRIMIVASLLLVCATASWGQAVFTSPLVQTGYVGVYFAYQITANVSATFSVSSLPSGLSLAVNQISGTPQAAGLGTNTVTLTATDNSSNTSTTNLTLIILPATPSPVITSPRAEIGYVNVPFSYTIVASNATGFSAVNLPNSWSVDPASGVISGTPILSGQSIITLIASNATSVPGSNTLTLTILQTATTNVIFSEGFENNFPAGWQVGDANTSGKTAYWAAVSSPFAGISTPDDSSGMGYCAGYGAGGSSVSPT